MVGVNTLSRGEGRFRSGQRHADAITKPIVGSLDHRSVHIGCRSGQKCIQSSAGSPAPAA
jgi:hypothetical protein